MRFSRAKLVLAILALGTLVVAFAGWLRTREPVYEGRSLTAWMQDVVNTQKPGVFTPGDIERRTRAEEVVKRMGARAVPALRRMMRTQDSRLRLEVVAFCGRHPWLKINFRPPAEQLQYWGVRGIRLLGPIANSATPELCLLLRSPVPHVRVGAATALGKMGVAAAPALPEIISMTTDPDPHVRAGTCRALADLGPVARPAADAVLQCLQDSDDSVFSAALDAAEAVGVGRSSRIAALGGQLAQKDPRIRYQAALALAACGDDARPSVPALIKALDDPDKDVREAASGALRKIDPQMTARIEAPRPSPPAADAGTGTATLALQGPASIALEIYKSIANVELVMQLPGLVAPGVVNIRATRPLSPKEAREFLEKALLEQAGLVLEPIDEKHVAVKMRPRSSR